MAEPDNLVPPQDSGAPAAQPPASLSAEDIQAMVAAEAQRIVDSRIPGLQSVYEKQIASLKKELKRAQADPDGYAGRNDSDLEAQLAQARREADSLRAGRLYPEAFPLYESLMSASSVEEQLELLEQYRKGTPAPVASQAPAPQAPAPVVPPIDPNRPLEPPMPGGGQMTREYADSILDRIGSVWPKFGG